MTESQLGLKTPKTIAVMFDTANPRLCLGFTEPVTRRKMVQSKQPFRSGSREFIDLTGDPEIKLEAADDTATVVTHSAGSAGAPAAEEAPTTTRPGPASAGTTAVRIIRVHINFKTCTEVFCNMMKDAEMAWQSDYDFKTMHKLVADLISGKLSQAGDGTCWHNTAWSLELGEEIAAKSKTLGEYPGGLTNDVYGRVTISLLTEDNLLMPVFISRKGSKVLPDATKQMTLGSARTETRVYPSTAPTATNYPSARKTAGPYPLAVPAVPMSCTKRKSPASYMSETPDYINKLKDDLDAIKRSAFKKQKHISALRTHSE